MSNSPTLSVYVRSSKIHHDENQAMEFKGKEQIPNHLSRVKFEANTKFCQEMVKNKRFNTESQTHFGGAW